jgi:predicted  nucleic acid-binding Zn-ribbon protein
MAENINALILPIGADPSQFKESLNDVKAAFKELGNTIASLPFNLVTDKQKEQFVGLLRTISTLTTDVKDFGKALQFPENSIAGITQKINDLNKLKISLDATTSSQEIAALTQQIEKLVAQKNAINSLGKTLVEAFQAPANSIAGLDKRIAELNKRKISLDATKSASEIARLTREIDKLTSKRNNLDNLGKSVSQVGNTTQGGFKKIEDSSKGAGRALTSLSLVAQDLPFGFIGIQNNLPAVIQTFGQLTKSGGGLQGALSQIGAALVGPAGLYLAFSVVTSAVTVAVQNFGSLQNAFDALFTSTSQATIAQRNYNKELKEGGKNLGSELSKVDLLSKGIANENLSREERLNYFFQAKKELPDLLAGLDEENILTKNGIKLLLANASARSKFLDLQVKQQAIGKVLNENYSEELDVQAKLVVEEKKRDKALRTITETQKNLNKATDKSSIKLFENILKQARKEFDFSVIAISKLKDELGKLQIVQSDYSGDLDGIVKGQGEYEKGVTRLTDGLTKLRNAQKEAGKEAKKNALKGDPIGTITEGVQINNGVITSDIAALTKVIQANVRLTNASVDQIARYRDSKLRQPLGSALDLVPNKISKIPAVPMSPELQSQIGGTKLMLEETAANFATAREALTDVFFNPLTDLFTNFTENGKNAFKEFGKAILATIKQLVARIIATGIINLLASILVPGGAQAASLLGTATGGGSKIGQAFGSAIRSVLGIKSIANPSFAGVGGGGMQMAGQVVFVQRGSDLVGVLNRTNGTINRVG